MQTFPIDAELYRILKFFSDGRPAKRVRVVGSLAVARLWCAGPGTSGTMRNGVKWFYGYTKI